MDQYEVKKVAEYEFIIFRINENGDVYSYKYPFFELNEANRVMNWITQYPSTNSIWEGAVPLYYRATYKSKLIH